MRYALIVAGGSGTRLWPMSRASLPKQLIPFIHGKSLLALAFDRLEGLVPAANRYICASQGHAELICHALGLPREQFLGEPTGRDTLNAVGYSAAVIARRNETLATAESCTGGGIANRVTNVSGASAVFLAGYVTYSNEAKTRDLAVPAELIARHGAVSPEVATAMAEGALRRAGSDWALATTGIAGPTGGTPDKPVGTVCIALAHRGEPTQVQTQRFFRDRDVFKDLVARTALAWLLKTTEQPR